MAQQSDHTMSTPSPRFFVGFAMVALNLVACSSSTSLKKTGDAAAVFRLPVQYTEKTGADATGYFKTEQGLLAVSTSPDHIGEWRQGEVTTLGFPHGKLHAFDAATGQRL